MSCSFFQAALTCYWVCFDMASLWFVLAIVYSLFTLKRRGTLGLFIISFIAILIVCILMITKSTFIPMDNAIADMSRISHNISPHILEKYGLITALENFLSEIKISDNTKFDINFEKFNRFDLKKELTNRANIFHKSDVRNIGELIVWAIKNNHCSIESLHPVFRPPFS